jgi:hypothetical protein
MCLVGGYQHFEEPTAIIFMEENVEKKMEGIQHVSPEC